MLGEIMYKYFPLFPYMKPTVREDLGQVGNQLEVHSVGGAREELGNERGLKGQSPPE